jgi:HSP20 family protein
VSFYQILHPFLFAVRHICQRVALVATNFQDSGGSAMSITRFTPYRGSFNDVALLQNRLNSIFQDVTHPAGESEALTSGSFVPAVDVYEDSQKVVLKLEVPGIKQEDLDIRVENQTLVVKGERKLEVDEKEENFHRIERRFGSFVRSFTLPPTVDTNAVSATYDAGVLTISIPKKAEAKPKQVKIEIGAGAQAGSGAQAGPGAQASKPKQVEASAA